MPIDRRRLVAVLALQPLVYAAGAQSAAARDVREIVAALRAFTSRHDVAPAHVCGSRFGDGGPRYHDVDRFVDWLSHQGTASRGQALEARRIAELERGDVMVIDGWVFSRTEALAASALAVLAKADCALPAQSTRPEGA